MNLQYLVGEGVRRSSYSSASLDSQISWKNIEQWEILSQENKAENDSRHLPSPSDMYWCPQVTHMYMYAQSNTTTNTYIYPTPTHIETERLENFRTV